MAERSDIDARMMDWLYDEPDTGASGVDTDELPSEHAEDLSAYRRVREAFRDLPDEEPPQALSAILLHEAAKRAPGGTPRAATAADGERGLWAWLRRLIGPIAAHPAAAAAATLLLVAGVAGALYVRGHTPAQPTAPSAAEEPVAATSDPAEPPASSATDGEPRAGAAEAKAADEALRLPLEDRGYTVQLADEEERAAVDTLTRDEGDSGGRDRKQQVADKEAPAPPPAPRRRSKPEGADVQANVISGADPLIELDDSDAETSVESTAGATEPEPRRDGTGRANTRQAPARESAAADGDAYRPYDDDRVDAKTRSLHRALENVAGGKKVGKKQCVRAARIANDILDRNPDYYTARVRGTREVDRCQMYVERERKSRVRRRAEEAASDRAAGEERPADTSFDE